MSTAARDQSPPPPATSLLARAGERTLGELRLDLGTAHPVSDLILRQRTALAERLSAIDEAAWQRPTRCEHWDVRDVVLHLLDTDRWTAETLDAAGGVPSVLARFDPRATPHEHVLLARRCPPSAPAAALLASSEAVAARLRSAEGPGASPVAWVGALRYDPGLAVLHLLWDSWLHERDLPIGDPPTDPAVAEAVAAYALFFAALSASRRLPADTGLTLAVELDGRRYDVRIGESVHVGATPDATRSAEAPDLRGPSAAVVEALSGRGELAEVAQAQPLALQIFDGFARAMRG
ncbi:MAG: maleylpyruvate isomerase N-terminal domain-containing protein [Sporichthyaceae bacterium]